MEGRNSHGGFGIGSTVSRLSIRRVRELVEWCCSCTRHSTCSTTGPSARACKCWNTGRQCNGCYYWGRCKNRVRLMPPPTTAMVPLGNFPRGADPPTSNQRASLPPVRSPTSLSLQTILAAGAGGGGVRGGAGRRKIPRDSGGGGKGVGGRSWDRRRTKRGTAGVEQGTTEATETTEANGKRRTTEDPSVSMQNNGAGGK